MTQRVNDIIEEARKLTPAERLQLFDQLEILFLGDEGHGPPEEIEAAWLEEVERRIGAFERGETTAIPHEDVMAELRRSDRRK